MRDDSGDTDSEEEMINELIDRHRNLPHDAGKIVGMISNRDHVLLACENKVFVIDVDMFYWQFQVREVDIKTPEVK